MERKPNLESQVDIKDLNFRLAKYGLKFLEEGAIEGPKKPKEFSKTPELTYSINQDKILENNDEFLKKHFLAEFSAQEFSSEILSIIDAIFRRLVRKALRNFACVIIMSKEDFAIFKQLAKPTLEQKRGISGDINGINMGGLIIVEDSLGNNIFPLIFHEVGHSLYPDTQDNYIDELRAMYFQILSVKMFEDELEKLGIHAHYADDYYKDTPMPTEEHKKAFEDARLLFTYQSFYDEVVAGNPRTEKGQEDLLQVVGQHTKSFKK